MIEDLVSRARARDENAFRELVDPYRGELQLHCYRIVGSVQDAEDLLQETLLAAWRGLDRFQGRASLRAWLYRIATNRCLNALRDRKRRPQEVFSMIEPPQPTRMAEPTWLEPYPDALLEGLADMVVGPEARYEVWESVGLAFVAALQHLPPRQRAALVLRDALGFDTAETAAILGSSEGSVKGALQRAAPRSTNASLPAVSNEHRCRRRRASESSSAISPQPSSAATRRGPCPCSPTTRGSRCRPSPTSTRARRQSPGSSRIAPRDGAPTIGLPPLAPTASRLSAATSPIPTPRSRAHTD